MTAGELRQVLAGIPDDAEVLVDGLTVKIRFPLFDAYTDTGSLVLVSAETPLYGPLSR